MPFDDKLMLRNGLVDLDQDEDNNPVLAVEPETGVVETHGAVCLDIRQTGAQGLVAVMICPTAPTGDYQATLTVEIEASDYLTDDSSYRTIASFPVLTTYSLRIGCTTTTPVFADDDIGSTLTETGGDSDSGTILWYDKALETTGGVGDIVVTMDASGDDFAILGAVLTSGGGGAGTSNKIGAADPMLSYGVYMVRFMTQKRYIRAEIIASGTSDWGKVSIFVTNAGFGDL